MQMVFLFVLLMLGSSVSANTYDPLLLRAQASIFPKIVLLDQDLKKKINNDEVVIVIVSTVYDQYVAKKLKVLIKNKYGDSLGVKKLTVNIKIFDEIDNSSLATAYIVLDGAASNIKKVVSYASSHERAVFSYSYSDFEYDTLISLFVKERTYVYLNKSAIRLYGIRFMPVFYKITKAVE